jgi:dTDP-4-amino-4,6-dideoxygalactose transaminase
MRIPLVDLKAQYESIKSELDDAVMSVISKTAFVRGPFVIDFEREFSDIYGVKNCISCGNGTDAIYAVLRSLGIGQGDEVITVANSWISTSETIGQTGALPVFVDIDDHFTIDVNKIEEKITPNTKAIIPVHLYGQSCDMDAIMRICNQHDLFCIEDCAQAHFATYKTNMVGTFGHAATFSFYPGKNLGAYGDAGAVITNNDNLARQVRLFVNHGSIKKHDHEIEGVNSRLDGIQAAVLLAKLPHIHEWNTSRNRIGLSYNARLSEIEELETPVIRPDNFHVFHVYCVMTNHRNELMEFLSEKGISTAIHYPTPLPFLQAYAYQENKAKDFPRVHENMSRLLSLPIYPEMTEEMIDYIVASTTEFFSSI